MVKAIEVARFLIHLAQSQEEEDRLSPLRLQKLLYYCQGWSLALRGKPLFDDEIQAWQHGPVVPTVYRSFKSYGYGSIDPATVPLGRLSPDEESLVRAVWDAYKGYSATSLREMTHQEAPWRDATKGQPAPGQAWDVPITKSSMKQYFTQQAKRR